MITSMETKPPINKVSLKKSIQSLYLKSINVPVRNKKRKRDVISPSPLSISPKKALYGFTANRVLTNADTVKSINTVFPNTKGNMVPLVTTNGVKARASSGQVMIFSKFQDGRFICL